MGAFFGALGRGLENYGKNALQNSRLGKSISQFGPHQQVSADEQTGALDTTPATSTDAYMPPDNSMAPPPPVDGMDAFAGGKLVTQPTVAMLGEKGPEAVVPLNSAPGQKVTPGMLGGGIRTRFRHPTGPNALRHISPVRADLPLKPNTGIR